MPHLTAARCLTSLVLCLAAASAAMADGADKARGRKTALLVAVRSYDRSERFPDLKYTENDVEKLAELLKKNGFSDVRVQTTTRGEKDASKKPTAANVRKALAELVEDRKKDDLLLVAFSGHGVEVEVEDPDGKARPKTFAYFCPADADLVNVSYLTGRSKRLIALPEVFDVLGKCGGTKLVLVDACRSEFKVEGVTRSLDVESVLIPRGVGALFSCSSGQKAFETQKLKHGVFFYHVLEGLRGKGKNVDGEVTWSSLGDYVTKKVSDGVVELIGGGAKQTPHAFNNIPGVSPVLVEAGSTVARQDEPKERVVAGPEAAFEKFRTGFKDRDFKAVFASLTPQAQVDLAGDLAFMALTTRALASLTGQQPDKEKAAGFAKFLARHGLSEAYQDEFTRRYYFLIGDAEAARKELRAASNKIKDRADFLSDLFTQMDKLTGDYRYFSSLALEELKAGTNSATAVLVVKNTTTTARQAVRFVKTKDGWLLNYETTSQDTANKGKIEGTKWTSDAQMVKGMFMPVGARSLEFAKNGALTFTRNNEAHTGKFVLGVGEFVRFDFDKDFAGRKWHLERVVVIGNRLAMFDADGTRVTFTKAK